LNLNVPVHPGGAVLSGAHDTAKEDIMLWTILIILLILWLLGFSLHVGGGLIHVLLVVALIVLIFNLVTGRRRIS